MYSCPDSSADYVLVIQSALALFKSGLILGIPLWNPVSPRAKLKNSRLLE